jgi:hypothetical protein
MDQQFSWSLITWPSETGVASHPPNQRLAIVARKKVRICAHQRVESSVLCGANDKREQKKYE